MHPLLDQSLSCTDTFAPLAFLTHVATEADTTAAGLSLMHPFHFLSALGAFWQEMIGESFSGEGNTVNMFIKEGGLYWTVWQKVWRLLRVSTMFWVRFSIGLLQPQLDVSASCCSPILSGSGVFCYAFYLEYNKPRSTTLPTPTHCRIRDNSLKTAVNICNCTAHNASSLARCRPINQRSINHCATLRITSLHSFAPRPSRKAATQEDSVLTYQAGVGQ